MKQPGAVYAYHRPTSDGKPIRLFMPDRVPGVDEAIDFAASVLAVVDTIGSFEKRGRDEVFADLLTAQVAPAAEAQSRGARRSSYG